MDECSPMPEISPELVKVLKEKSKDLKKKTLASSYSMSGKGVAVSVEKGDKKVTKSRIKLDNLTREEKRDFWNDLKKDDGK